MIPFSDSFFRDAVTLYAVTETVGASATPKRAWAAQGTALRCRAESSTGSSTNSRRAIYSDAEESHTTWTLGFPADPASKLGDKIVFASDGRSLVALGPSRRDASGDSVLYLLDCEECE